jgi:hypothetical protein
VAGGHGLRRAAPTLALRAPRSIAGRGRRRAVEHIAREILVDFLLGQPK